MAQLGDVKVSEIMTHPVITVTADAGIKTAAELLVGRGISALPVVDKKGVLVGIVSEADLVPMETWPDPRTQATPQQPTAWRMPSIVAEVMTREVLTVPANSEVSRAARIMLEAGIKRAPVMRAGRVVGILSRRDLVKVIARRDADIEAEIKLRLGELGFGNDHGAVGVAAGVVTFRLAEGPGRRLAETVALTVPGVLEVRFAGGEKIRAL
jgi:CBS domain-containing protein/putative component of toxin-antitoxin plasmid stabilization module